MVNFKEIYHFARFQRGSNIFQGGGGGPTFSRGGGGPTFSRGGGGSIAYSLIETHITCDFPGGGADPLSPPPSGSALALCREKRSKGHNYGLN